MSVRAASGLVVSLGLAAALLAPALELATGRPEPYLLVLTALAALGWWRTRLSRTEVGVTWGRPVDHLLALAYPVVVLGGLAGVALAFGAASLESVEAERVTRNLALMFLSTWVGSLITEEGFYRGTLWGIAGRAGWRPAKVLWITALMFMLWHVAVPIIESDFALPVAQIPVYLANVFLLGLAWGALRLGSGSVLVACSAHASWNAMLYVLFGFGQRSGTLALDGIALWDAERGLLGVALNAAVAWLLWRWARKRQAGPA